MFRELDVALNDWLMHELSCGRETNNYGAYFMPEVVLSSENTPKRSRSVWVHLLNKFRERWSEKAWKRKPFTKAAQTHTDLYSWPYQQKKLLYFSVWTFWICCLVTTIFSFIFFMIRLLCLFLLLFLYLLLGLYIIFSLLFTFSLFSY